MSDTKQCEHKFGGNSEFTLSSDGIGSILCDYKLRYCEECEAVITTDFYGNEVNLTTPLTPIG